MVDVGSAVLPEAHARRLLGVGLPPSRWLIGDTPSLLERQDRLTGHKRGASSIGYTVAPNQHPPRRRAPVLQPRSTQKNCQSLIARQLFGQVSASKHHLVALPHKAEEEPLVHVLKTIEHGLVVLCGSAQQIEI